MRIRKGFCTSTYDDRKESRGRTIVAWRREYLEDDVQKASARQKHNTQVGNKPTKAGRHQQRTKRIVLPARITDRSFVGDAGH